MKTLGIQVERVMKSLDFSKRYLPFYEKKLLFLEIQVLKKQKGDRHR